MTAILLFALLLQSQEIDELVAKQVDSDDPGVAVLFMKEGKAVFKKGYGAATLDPRAPVTPDTLFELASCSKRFTAVAILILREQGKLKLDQDIRTWLPEVKESDEPIRLRDLVHHTSGLPDYLGFLTPESKLSGNLEALKLIADRKLEFKTGRQWAYSNTNYCLLALIIERISKKSFGAFLKDELFGPLKMKTATVLEKGAAPKNAASGYANEGRKFDRIENPILTTGDGGIYLSLEDWVAFEAGLPTLLKKETLTLANTPGKFSNGKAHDYAFGVIVRREGERTVIAHEGAWAGFRSLYVRWIEDDASVILMANRIDLNMSGLARDIAGKFLPR